VELEQEQQLQVLEILVVEEEVQVLPQELLVAQD
jgi:hypothetical protein